VFVTPDLRVAVDPAKHQPMIEHVRAAWSDHPQTTIDGVRVDTPAGWVLMRPSVTEAALTFRFESVDWHGLNHLVRRFCDTLPEAGDALWDRYQTAVGMAQERA
jgi:phosphomannomutase